MQPLPNKLRLLFVISLVFTLSIAVSAQSFDPFMPTHPMVMGRGGSFTATAEGYNTFFFNPAGFAADGELTLASATVWAFTNSDTISLAQDLAGSLLGLPSSSVSAPTPSFDDVAVRATFDEELLAGLEEDLAALSDWVQNTPDEVLEQIVQDVLDDPGYQFESEADLAEFVAAAGQEDAIAFLEAVEEAAAGAGYPLPVTVDQLEAKIAEALPGGYVNAGAMAGLGYAGRGIGLGVFANVEGTVDGTNILQASGSAFNTITFVGGLGLSFGELDVGIALRPIVLGYSRMNMGPLLTGYLAGGSAPSLNTVFANTVYFGSGLAVDIGAAYNMGPLRVGFSVKDLLGTQLGYRKASFDQYVAALQEFALPTGSALTDEELASAWTIPMKMNVGLEFHPDLGVVTYLLDPRLSVDIVDLLGIVGTAESEAGFSLRDALSMLHLGGEARILRFLSLRGGYYGGYLSGGVGVEVLFADVNAAVAGDFGRDADGVWGFSTVGGSFEVAIRF